MVIAAGSRTRTQQAPNALVTRALVTRALAMRASVMRASATHVSAAGISTTHAWTMPAWAMCISNPRNASARAVVRFVLAVAFVAGLAGCNAMPASDSPNSVAADEAAIADFNRQYLGAINDGDIAKLSSLTTDGHIMIPPGRPPIVGKAANDAANGAGFERVKIDEHWMPVETVVSGDLAYQRGTYTVVATPKAVGEARKMSGAFLRIYQRQPDGAWRMTRDMFNSDTPTASGP